MNELAQALIADSYAAAPAHILEAVAPELIHREHPGIPHTIYGELWHLSFWQAITLDWVRGIETPFPASPSDAFPCVPFVESFEDLQQRFLRGAREAAEIAQDDARCREPIRCPSRPGLPTRVMSVGDQLLSLAAHNAYHLGRIVVLRQLGGSWPPPSGGFRW